MAWINLGKLSLSPEWQRFELLSIDDSLLRVTHSFDEKPLGYALLSSVFLDGSRGMVRRLYPYKTETQVMSYGVDEQFREAGFSSRFLEIKIHPRTRFYSLGWTVELEIWSEDETEAEPQ